MKMTEKPMNKTRCKALTGVFLLACILLVTPIIIAQPPIQQNINIEVGIDIQYPAFDTLEQGRDFDFQFHAFNISNGILLSNDTTSCGFHLFNRTGEHVVDLPLEMAVNLIDFNLLIKGGNFSEVGNYNYIVQCNTSTIGGFISVPFKVTNILATDEGNTAMGILFAIIVLAFLFMILSFRFLDSEALYPIGLFFLGLTLICSVFVLNLTYVYSRDILLSPMMESIQWSIYFGIMYSLIGIAMIFMLFLIMRFVKLFRDKKLRLDTDDGWDMGIR